MLNANVTVRPSLYLHASSGVATVGHGLARAHPTSAMVGREICTNSKSFLEEYRAGVADSA